MSDNNQQNRKNDSTGEGNMDIDIDECPPHGPKCSICKKYANHKARFETDDDDTTHLKQKLLKHTADALHTEAGLHKKIADLQAELHKKGDELWKLKEENMKRELEAEKGKRTTEGQLIRPPLPKEPIPKPPPPREPTLRGRSPQRRSRSTSRASTPQRRSMSPPRRQRSPMRRQRSPYRPQLRSRSPYRARRRSPSPTPRPTTAQRPPSAPKIRPFGPPVALNRPPTAPRADNPTNTTRPAQTSVHAMAMAAWRGVPPSPAPTTPTPSTTATVAPTVTNAPPTVTTHRPDPNIKRDESDYDAESTDEERKKKRKFPRPPKVPKKKTAAVRDQRAFIGPRAPRWDELPRLTQPPQRINMDFNEPEARKMLRDVQSSGRFDLINTIKRIVTETQSRRRNGIPVPSGPALVEREWKNPDWYNDAKRIRMVCESEERQRDTPFTDLRLDLPSRGQPSHQSDREEHARWAAMYGTPSTYPGVSISSTLQLDLLGIQADMYFRQLVPTNRSYTGPRTRDKYGTPPGTRARTRWIVLFIELLSQPYLYEQLVSYYGFQINPRPSFSLFNGSPNTDMRELVSGLARRGFTAQHSHWMYKWAMSYLRDAEYIHDNTSNHGDFPRGLLLSRAADRLREVGAPSVIVPFRRLWSPPTSWNVELYFQERNRRLTLAGQQRRTGRHNLVDTTGMSTATGDGSVRTPTSPADARERGETAAPTPGAAGSSSGTIVPSRAPAVPTPTILPHASPDEDTHMEDVSTSHLDPSAYQHPVAHTPAPVHPNAVVPYPPPGPTHDPSTAPAAPNQDATNTSTTEDAMDQD